MRAIVALLLDPKGAQLGGSHQISVRGRPIGYGPSCLIVPDGPLVQSGVAHLWGDEEGWTSAEERWYVHLTHSNSDSNPIPKLVNSQANSI